MQRLATIALVIPLMSCATAGRALSVTACVVADERLGTAVRDPASVVEYFRDVISEGKRIVAAVESGDAVAEDAAAWIADMLDLVDRMRACVPEQTAQDVELQLMLAAATL